jgi:hypothetical protein
MEIALTLEELGRLDAAFLLVRRRATGTRWRPPVGLGNEVGQSGFCNGYPFVTPLSSLP